MRALSDDLRSIQSHPDALATVTVRCKRRSTFSGDPLLWRPMFQHTAANIPYGDVNVTAAACSCAQSGTVIRVLRSTAAKKVGVQRFTVTSWTGTGSNWPSAATAALTAAPVQVATLASTDTRESTPGVGRIGSEIRILYGDGPKLYCVQSTNDGVSWGLPAVVYDGSLSYARFNNISICGYGSTWICVLNGYNNKGIPVVIGLHDAGAGWVAWSQQQPANYGHWQVAGVRPGPEAPTNCRVYAYLWGTEYDASGAGWNSLACQQIQVNGSGVFTAWGSRTVVDRAGVAGAAAYDRVRFGEGGGAYLFALQERAASGYWFVSSLYALPGNTDMEEPVFLGDADGTTGSVAPHETLQPVAAGRRAWLIGAGQVWTSAQTDAAVDLTVRTYTPIKFEYVVSTAGGGVLQLQIERQVSAEPSAGSALERFGSVYPPEIYVGDMLWLDRTLAVGTIAGTKSLAFRVAAVTYRRGCVDVLALDALGVLSHMRPRRAKVLMQGDRLRMADVEAMCHWAGLTTTGAGLLPGAVYPSPGFIWPANDSGLSALRRYLSDQPVVLRAAGADTEQDHTRVAVLPLPRASAYTYVSPNGLAEGSGRHELADWALTHDGRNTRLFVAVGLRAGASATTGEAWAMAAARARIGGRPPDGLRPVPYVAVDRSMAWADGSLAARVAAEAEKLAAGLAFGWIEASANLGIELYDVVTVDGTDVRVVGITEEWDRGRLRQRLELAEVDSYGVFAG